MITEPIRYTLSIAGAGAAAIGAALCVLPHHATHGQPFRALHELPMPLWGAIFIAIGLALLAATWAWWRAVPVPVAALTALMNVWAISFVVAAVGSDGRGSIGAITWVTLAALIWMAGRRAARITAND